ncbi:glycosyltransferase family 39 protein [Clostridium akagii]|uniref:glycosyltransferase family 39 protein n=1 Tax=Clostridium akagii TaxID=91623 RepID=UPI00047999CE|nr:glycosyltransferase family 39 protein [Clostridium akagii]
MKKIKFTKNNIALGIIVVLSAILNFGNLSIEGYGNAYYAAAVKSMTLSWKNLFFVSFDPAGFVTIDKPPLGFWLQAISAKIFGFSGVSILLPSALAGVISVILVHHLVKKSFGSVAGLLSALFLAITPVFVAVSRNNTIDNILILFLLLACWALLIAAEKGKLKYLILSMVFVGLGFNVKMTEAYLVIPALYLTYLLSNAISLKKRIAHLLICTVILLGVSFSWALIVDAVPASSRPYVDSSTNNTVTELIVGHNGSERFSLSSSSKTAGGGGGTMPSGMPSGGKAPSGMPSGGKAPSGMQGGGTAPSGTMPSGVPKPSGTMPNGMQGGSGSSSSQLQGTFGGEITSGLTRLFLKSILSDQIVWFIPLAIFGFIAVFIKEKLRFLLNNKRKQSIVMWFAWFSPEFLYFSFNTGTFHSYYLTMLAPPTAALAGIGIVALWELYKEGTRKAWLLPVALLLTGATHLLMLYYFISYSNIIKVLIVLVALLCVISSIILGALNIRKKTEGEQGIDPALKLRKILISLALVGMTITPLVGSSAVLFTKLSSSFPAAGLELLSGTQSGGMGSSDSSSSTKLISLLEKNKSASQKYLLVVNSSSSAADIIISTGEPVMSLGGFLGSDKIVTLAQFKQMVKSGEIRYVMAGGMGGGTSSSDIMTWVKKTGKLVSSSLYSDASKTSSNITSGTVNTTTTKASSSDSKTKTSSEQGGMNSSQQLYDLKAYTDSSTSK